MFIQKFIIAALAGFLAVIFTINANATSHGNEWLFGKTYAKSGNWRILHGKDMGDTCVAEVDNASVTLRILHTDYTGDWYIGVPYYDDASRMGGFGVENGANSFNDAVKYETGHVNGWAMYFFQEHIRKALRSGSSVSIDLDRGLQRWSLSGSSKAIALLTECARNGGKRPAKAKRQIQVQAKVQPSNQNRFAGNNNIQSQNSGGGGFEACQPPNAGHASPNSNQAVSISISADNNIGQYSRSVNIHWIDFNGNWQHYKTLSPGQAYNQQTFAGHLWVAQDANNQCQYFTAGTIPQGSYHVRY